MLLNAMAITHVKTCMGNANDLGFFLIYRFNPSEFV